MRHITVSWSLVLQESPWRNPGGSRLISNFLMEGSSCHLVVGKGSGAGTRPQQPAVRVGRTCSPGGHKWVGRSGETQSTPWTLQNLGCHIKEARTGIIPNNRIFPIVCQGLSKVLFALLIFWSSQQPIGRKGTSTQRSQCPSSHN